MSNQIKSNQKSKEANTKVNKYKYFFFTAIAEDDSAQEHDVRVRDISLLAGTSEVSSGGSLPTDRAINIEISLTREVRQEDRALSRECREPRAVGVRSEYDLVSDRPIAAVPEVVLIRPSITDVLRQLHSQQLLRRRHRRHLIIAVLISDEELRRHIIRPQLLILDPMNPHDLKVRRRELEPRRLIIDPRDSPIVREWSEPLIHHPRNSRSLGRVEGDIERAVELRHRSPVRRRRLPIGQRAEEDLREVRVRDRRPCAPDVPLEEARVRAALRHVQEVHDVGVLLLGEAGDLGEGDLGLAAQERGLEELADLDGVGLPGGAVDVVGLVPEPGVDGADGGPVGARGVGAVLDHDAVGGLRVLGFVGLVEADAEHAVDGTAAACLVAKVGLIPFLNVLAVIVGVELPLGRFNGNYE